MTTIKDIATLAGVSRGTVDRVLNNRGSVSQKTAEKIRKIAKDLDYKPNPAGLVLAAHKKNIKLGVILFQDENPFFSEVIEGIQEKADELSAYNCQILMKQVPFGAEYQLKALEDFQKQEVQGIALTPYNDITISQKMNQLSDEGIVFVTFNTDIPDAKRLCYVGSDFVHCGKTAAGLMHLLTNGTELQPDLDKKEGSHLHPSVYVGIVSGSSKILCHTERIKGFEKRIQEKYPWIQIADIVENNDDEKESYRKTKALIEKNPQINALFFAAGGVSGGCIAAKELNYGSIPILAFDSVPSTKSLMEKGIVSATICQQPKVQGYKPLEILFHYLSTGETPASEFLFVDVDIRILENL